MRIGIAGPEQSGKTTTFELLTGLRGGSAGTAAGSGGRGARGGHGGGPAGGVRAVGVSKVPDPRIDWLSSIFHPKKTTYATIEWVEVEGGAARLAAEMRTLDAAAVVVRAFRSDRVPHPAGSIDPHRDFEQFWQELLLADWGLMDTRLTRLEQASSVPKKDRRELEQEREVLTRCREALEAGMPLRRVELGEEERRFLQSYSLVTLKPVLAVVNVGEEQLREGTYPGDQKLRERCRELGVVLVEVCAELEREIAELEPEERGAFLADLGVEQSGIERLARAAYEALDRISFFTAGEDEVKAWTIARGTNARDAAGKVHSDMARGFIRAEVIAFEDFRRAEGSMAKARQAGMLRLEGKQYEVKDGDIIEFRFNV